MNDRHQRGGRDDDNFTQRSNKAGTQKKNNFHDLTYMRIHTYTLYSFIFHFLYNRESLRWTLNFKCLFRNIVHNIG
jgi:hypothetical protein